MIRKLFTLNLKALSSGALRINKAGGKNAFTGEIWFIVLIAIIVGASLFGIFLSLFNVMLEPYFTAGIGWMYFAVLALTVFALCVVSTIFTASAQIFGAKDNELLLSMPIRPSAILLSRLLVLLVMEYFFTLVAALAAFFPWLAGGYATASGILFFVIGVLLLPLLSLAVSLLLAWVLGFILSRVRYKNIVTLVVSIGFLLAYFYFYFNMQSYLNELLMRGEEIAEAFRMAMPPFYAFGRSVADGSASAGLQFILWAILPFAAAVALLAVNYGKVLTVNRGGIKIEYKERAAKSQSSLTALTRKELAHFRSKPTVILNASLGSLFMLIGGIAILVKGSEILSYLTAMLPALNGVSLSALCAALLVFLCSANNLSASLISFEGRNLWIMKSSPVSPKTVLLAKAGAHWLISAIPCFAASACAGIVVAGSVWDWLVVLLLPQTFIVLTAVGGLAINLNLPKLEWSNEIYVVKQSASAMITLFGGMGAIALIGLLYALLFSGMMSLMVYLLFCAAVFVIAVAAICIWLMNVGTKKFAAL
ncbi:MAG: hypothetical protein LBQ21_06160 [Clostridiales Family XIII bacterium]|jgi:ABC-2 type transport system permease protein|nr:hypothetical protein [Clostridiales Family XIII bacterium]